MTKPYERVEVLKDASLRVEGGRVMSIVGENGAGKSTLMRILSGVTAPDSGEILIDGEPVNLSGPAAASRRGVVRSTRFEVPAGAGPVTRRGLLGLDFRHER
jgi:ABC-type sugar transport system ATPase subunit